MGLIKFLFITLLVLYLIRLLVRILLPLFLQKAVNKMANQQQSQQKRRKPEGAISIDYMPPAAKTGKTDKLGDFVDFEEVK